jgi:hypothetical protein
MLSLSFNNRHKVLNVFASTALAKNGTIQSEIIDVTDLLYFTISLEWTLVGAGTAKFEVYASNNGVTFVDVNSDIAAAQTVGTSMASLVIKPCAQIYILVTEANVDTLTVSGWLVGY